MFTNVGWGELLVLLVVALVVLGPERLPDAVRWLAGSVRRVKEFAGKAQQQLKDDFGDDFEDFREPLAQLNELRGMGPRALVTKHLLDGDDSLFTGDFGAAAPKTSPADHSVAHPPAGSTTPAVPAAPSPTPSPAPGPTTPTRTDVGSGGGTVPWDADAT